MCPASGLVGQKSSDRAGITDEVVGSYSVIKCIYILAKNHYIHTVMNKKA